MPKKGEIKNLVSCNHTLYKKLSGMINRCHKSKEGSKGYKNYQSRGISVCYEWRHDINKEGFNNFYTWAINNGYEDGLSIDRIDVNGNYEPSNCRWITMFEQQGNKTNNRYIKNGEVVKHASEWARELEVTSEAISERIRRGWKEEDLLLPLVNKTAEYTSEIFGVHWNVSRKRWKAMSKLNGNKRQEFIGWYYTQERAEYAKIKYETEGVKIHNKEIADEMLLELQKLKEDYEPLNTY